MNRAAVLALLVTLALPATPVFAASKKEECIGAFDKAQRARREGHLKDAKDALLVCAQDACPAVVRTDCADVLKQVDAAQPTIVLKAADAKGNDLADVTVELNGNVIASSLDGRALPVDPGKLSLVFKRPPWDPVKVDIVIAEAEKSRTVNAVLGPPAPVVVAPPPPRLAPAPKREVVGYAVPGALAAVGVGALVFAGIVRAGAGSDAEELKSRCGPTCPEGERSRLSDELVKANVGLVIGLGALVLTGVTWFLFAPRSSNKTASLVRGLTW